jgi:DNA-binding transcriptional LysR family regulator
MPSILKDLVELRHLRYFRAVAEVGSFSRAAALIGLRQPTLSQQIQQMEKALGVTLFSRTRRMCRLTPAGEMLMPYARRVLGEMADLRRSLDDLSGLRQGSLTVAVLPVLSYRVMPVVMARFQKLYPGIRVRLLEMSVDEMERALVVGTVEMGIGIIAPAEASLRGVPLFDEELVALVASGDVLARRATVAMEELAERPLIVAPAGYGTRTIILKACAQARRSPEFAVEASSVDVVFRTVAGGGGVGVLPETALWGRGPELKPRAGGESGTGASAGTACKVVRIVRPTLRRKIGFLDVHGSQPRPAAEVFMPLVRAAVKEFEGG